MKITKTTLLFIATLFFLALPLMFVNGNAQAAIYNYDGAIHDATTHGWEVPADNGTCFGADASDPAGTPAHALGGVQSGTGNSCRTIAPAWLGDINENNDAACVTDGYADCQTECTTLGYSWHTHSHPYDCINNWTDDTSAEAVAGRGAHECLYCHDGGHASNRSDYLKGGHKNMSRASDGIPWTTSIEFGSVDVPGYDWTTPGTSANGTTSPSTLADGTTPVFWIYDGWLSDTPRAATPGTSYSCGRCHTTGWTADASINTSKEPEASFPGINNDVNLSAADDSGTMQPSSSWDHFGILCSRCHDAVDGGHANSGTGDHMEFNGDAASAASQNVVCYNCHRQVDSNNLPLDAATRKIGEELNIANSHGALGIKSHANGYLNSPHARFSGTYGQLADSTQYDSHFITSDGGCAACHNVHDSLTDTAVGAKPWNKECGLDCHSQDPTSPYNKSLTHINHVAGVGTPLENATADDPVSACQTCHMPNGLHLFRISTDPTYKTFGAGAGNNIETIPDASHNNFPSAYVSLDLACGQCHNPAAPQNGAPPMTVEELAPYAQVMHGGSVTSQKLFTWTNDSSTSYMVNFVVTGSACPEGGCTYSWDFGTTCTPATGTGPATSTTCTSAPATVTLTVSNGGTTTQVVTPTAIHQSPTCNPAITTPMSGTVNVPVSFTDGSTADGSAAVYINWGDGSSMSVATAGTGATVSHSYIWPGNYMVTQIVQDELGFNCTQKFPLAISKAGVAAGSGNLEIDTDATFAVSYYVKGDNGFGTMVTKASGSLPAGGNVSVALAPGDYNVYLYFANGHSCTWTQGQAANVQDTLTTTVSATGCN